MSDEQWEPTPELRYERRVHPFDLNSFDVLQQRWRKPTFNGFGHLNGWEYDWRDIPRVQADSLTVGLPEADKTL